MFSRNDAGSWGNGELCTFSMKPSSNLPALPVRCELSGIIGKGQLKKPTELIPLMYA